MALQNPFFFLSDGPWKHIPASPSSPPAQQNFLGSPTGVLSSPTSFIEIVQSEETNRERAERIKKKPLSMIQVFFTVFFHKFTFKSTNKFV